MDFIDIKKHLFVGIFLLGCLIFFYVQSVKIESLENEVLFLESENEKVLQNYNLLLNDIKKIEADRTQIQKELLEVTANASKKYNAIDKNLNCEAKLMEFLKRANQ